MYRGFKSILIARVGDPGGFYPDLKERVKTLFGPTRMELTWIMIQIWSSRKNLDPDPTVSGSGSDLKKNNRIPPSRKKQSDPTLEKRPGSDRIGNRIRSPAIHTRIWISCSINILSRQHQPMVLVIMMINDVLMMLRICCAHVEENWRKNS